MDKKSLDAILKDFDFSAPKRPPAKKSKLPATFWIPREYMEIYAQLQKKSKQRFSGVIREMIMAAIDQAKDLAELETQRAG
jgi:hypothetical protein